MGKSETTLKERIARAINELAYAPHEESWAKERWPTFLPHAEAVLTAIREPTDAMEAAGYEARDDYADNDSVGRWRAMIAAALRED